MTTRAVIALLFVVIVCAALGRTVPDVVDRPLVRAATGLGQVVPLPSFTSQPGDVRRGLDLRTADAAALASYDELRVVVGTYDTAPVLSDGLMTLAGRCVYRAEPGRLRENTTLRFRREARCDGLPQAPADVVLALTFTAPTPRDARAALWVSPAAADPGALLTGSVEGSAFAAAGRAIARRSDTRTSRAVLLAFMWDLPAWSVWLLVGAAGALAVGGAALLDRPSWPATISAFALTAGLALCYAVVVPPLQAPDEPDHLLSFAKLSERPALESATSSWAKRIHFYRLTFMSDERLRPADREVPFERDWEPADVFAENVRHRSSTSTRLWSALQRLVPQSPPHALLFFRAVGSIIVALAFAAGTALLVAGGAASLPALLTMVLLLIPTLPFFGMHMSELTFTLCAFVLAGHAAVLLLSGAPGRLTGPVLGLAVALLAAGPRSGWPTLIVIAGLAAGRILAAAADRSRPLSDTAWFWIGIAAPGLVLFGTRLLWIPAPFYEQWHLAGLDPRAGLSSASFLLILGIGSAGGGLAEWVLRRAPAVGKGASAIARVLCGVAALGVAATLIWSARGTLPMLPTVESVAPASARDYVVSVLWPIATAARVRGFDFLTWTSLWGGFGWADAILPAPAIAIVTVVAAIAALLTLIAATRASDGRAVVTICGVAGVAAAAAAAALSSYGLHRNVHGRYLLGGCVIGLCLLAAPSLLEHGRRISPAVRTATLLALACGLHAFALMFLLEKYFG